MDKSLKVKVWELVKEMVDFRAKNITLEDWHYDLDKIVEDIESLALMVEQRGGA